VRWQEISALPCSIARTLAVVGDRWAILVLREALNGVTRFDQFQAHLGVARNVLAARLRHLVEQGVLERVPYGTHPGRFAYELTERGRALYPVVLSLLSWGDSWLAGDDGPPVRLEHRGCGQRFSPQLVCSECGEPLAVGEVRAVAGPGLLRPGGSSPARSLVSGARPRSSSSGPRAAPRPDRSSPR
jgi:DNA-binding HxlR family transcriptional regulator